MNFKSMICGLAMMSLAMTAFARTEVVAHRGYWRADGSAQNSLRSLAKADSIGAWGSEFDVWLTSDDKLIVNHDAVFKGVKMEDSDYATIRDITLDNGERLPDLDEYLEKACEYPNLKLVLELKALKDKTREAKAAEMIVEKIREKGLAPRTVYISFSLDACKAFKQLDPEAEVQYLEGDLTPAEVKRNGLDAIDYSGRKLREHPEWIEEAHKEGLRVNVWTIDTPELIDHFIKSSVDFITTNQPEEALKAAK